jgi:iron complex transport system ATP-binding protein
MIEASKIIFNIGKKTLLNDVSLTAAAGEVVAVVGANGAGKSTLLKVLSGDLRAKSGRVSFEGRPLRAWRVEEIARVRAVLPQSSTLTFPFTAFEVVLLGRTPHLAGGRGRQRDAEISFAALKMADVADLAERDFRTLSGGEQQRVSLARVLAQIWDQPASGNRYLLLDEPTASLDMAHQHLILRAARKFADEGTAVLVVLHDLNLGAAHADRMVMMKNGRVLQIGKPAEVLQSNLIKEVFAVETVITKHPTRDVPLVIPFA